jgi:type II secretion system protein G
MARVVNFMIHKSRFGFTLIELLIVVAIIAILAAIAVPNFLEAQTRAKVSRSKADMRSLTTAIEAYRIDWNDYPSAGQWICGPDAISPVTFNNRLRGCTTPVSYITSLPQDVFKPQEAGMFPFSAGQPPTFEYEDLETSVAGANPPGVCDFDLFSDRAAYRDYFGHGTLSIDWHLLSAGPDKVNDFDQTMNHQSAGQATIERGFNQLYDPTNGTVSIGDIRRTSAEQVN